MRGLRGWLRLRGRAARWFLDFFDEPLLAPSGLPVECMCSWEQREGHQRTPRRELALGRDIGRSNLTRKLQRILYLDALECQLYGSVSAPAWSSVWARAHR